jgi:hypothetical protein
LYSKYRNVAQILRNQGLLPSKYRSIKRSAEKRKTLSALDPITASANKLWLQTNDTPWPIIEEKWKKTHLERMQTYAKLNYEGTVKLTDEWPALRLANGWQLVSFGIAGRIS